MRVSIKGQTVRLYPEGEREERQAITIAFGQRCGITHDSVGKCLRYEMPRNSDLLFVALRALLGEKRGRYTFNTIAEHTR